MSVDTLCLLTIAVCAILQTIALVQVVRRLTQLLTLMAMRK